MRGHRANPSIGAGAGGGPDALAGPGTAGADPPWRLADPLMRGAYSLMASTVVTIQRGSCQSGGWSGTWRFYNSMLQTATC